MHMQLQWVHPPENYKMHPLIFRALIIIIVKETSVLYCRMWPSAKIWEKIMLLTLSSFFWNGNIYKEKILKNASKCLHPLMQEIVSLQELRRAFYESEPIIWRKLGNRLLNWPAKVITRLWHHIKLDCGVQYAKKKDPTWEKKRIF